MSLLESFWAAPPVARTYAALIAVSSIAAMIQIISPASLLYNRYYVFNFPPELWRLFTSFSLTGGMGIVFMPYTVWQYAVPLERDSPRFTSATFLVYMLFVGSFIILSAGEFMGAPVFTGAMMAAITYTFAQEHRGQTVQFFVIPLQVKYLPYVMLIVTLLQGSPIMALIEATGILAAHLYDVLTVYWPRYGGGTNLLPTPAILERMFENIQGAHTLNAKDRGPTARTTGSGSSSASATASGVSNPLSFQGRGRRLGGT